MALIGAGTIDDKYQIWTRDDAIELLGNITSTQYAELRADIDCRHPDTGSRYAIPNGNNLTHIDGLGHKLSGVSKQASSISNNPSLFHYTFDSVWENMVIDMYITHQSNRSHLRWCYWGSSGGFRNVVFINFGAGSPGGTFFDINISVRENVIIHYNRTDGLGASSGGGTQTTWITDHAGNFNQKVAIADASDPVNFPNLDFTPSGLQAYWSMQPIDSGDPQSQVIPHILPPVVSQMGGQTQIDGIGTSRDIMVVDAITGASVYKTTTDQDGNWSYDSVPSANPVLVIAYTAVGKPWQAQMPLTLDELVSPLVDNAYRYRVTVAGVTGDTEPTWPVNVGGEVQVGTATVVAEKLYEPVTDGAITPDILRV